MQRLSEEEFLFIWVPVLEPDTAWSEYCDYTLWFDLDELDLPVNADYRRLFKIALIE